MYGVFRFLDMSSLVCRLVRVLLAAGVWREVPSM